MASKQSFDRATVSQRLIETVDSELPWANEHQAKIAAFHAQDLAEAALSILCCEPNREINEKQKAEFVYWTADTQLTMLTTQVKEWGLWQDAARQHVESNDMHAAPDKELVQLLLRASFILACLGQLDEASEAKMKKIGGEDWKEAIQAKLRIEKQDIIAIQESCTATGMSEKRANSFVLSGFGCGLGNALSASPQTTALKSSPA